MGGFDYEIEFSSILRFNIGCCFFLFGDLNSSWFCLITRFKRRLSVLFDFEIKILVVLFDCKI